MDTHGLKKQKDQLEEVRKQRNYFKNIAIETGRTHLQEVEKLSSLIKSYKQIVSNLEKQILHRKSAEDATKASHQLLLTILNSIDATIYVADMNSHQILFANSYMTKMFDRKLIGEKCFEVFRDGTSPCTICTNEQLVDDQGNPTGMVVWQGQDPINKRWYINHDRAIRWPDGRIVRIQIATDISDLKKMEKEKEENEKVLMKSRQLELVGTLAGGIAHDFNNLLMGIQGWVSLMSTDFDSSHPASEKIRTIEKYIDSASGLTKKLLGLAKKGKYEVRPIDINELLVDSSTMFGRTAKEIYIHTKLHNPAPVVEADKPQIEQVLLNLYINALQAMPKNGELFLGTDIVYLSDDFCNPYGVQPGRYAHISVRDIGLGMDKETLERIFDPFFTTKDKGRGTGLGLASVYGIINNHDGFITADSKPGNGTTFNIYLPLSDQEVKLEPIAAKGLANGDETVLLVDDEDMIIEVGKAMLQKLGYRVLVAKDGQEAIDIVFKDHNKISLIILDMIMPGMDGGMTFNIIHEKFPNIPVLLSTGYSIDGTATEIMQRGCNGFIQKPFSLFDVSHKIRMIIDSGNTPA